MINVQLKIVNSLKLSLRGLLNLLKFFLAEFYFLKMETVLGTDLSQ